MRGPPFSMDEHLTSPTRDSQSSERSDTGIDSINERLCTDLVQRWHRGERVPVEAYLRQHPDLESGECAFELILTEVVLRQESGEAPPLEEYLWRCSHFVAPLRRHLTLHAGLAGAGPGD